MMMARAVKMEHFALQIQIAMMILFVSQEVMMAVVVIVRMNIVEMDMSIQMKNVMMEDCVAMELLVTGILIVLLSIIIAKAMRIDHVAVTMIALEIVSALSQIVIPHVEAEAKMDVALLV